MKIRSPLVLLSITVSLVAVVVLGNYISLQLPLSKVISADQRNKGLSVFAHYKYFVSTNSLVFDLRSVSGDSSPMDVTRVLLQYASALKDKDLQSVALAYRGKEKFLLKGEYFHRLGVEYGTQNPVYTIRTLPENVYKLDGSAAFGTWTGGVLGVTGKQMEDSNEFHRQWYIAEMAQRGG